MQISRKYLHDRSALSLTIVNFAGMLFVVLYVLLRYESSRHIFSSYRPQLPATDVYGNGTARAADFYAFAVFAFVATCMSIALAYKSHKLRKTLAVTVLLLNIVTLVFCFVVANSIFNLGIGSV